MGMTLNTIERAHRHRPGRLEGMLRTIAPTWAARRAQARLSLDLAESRRVALAVYEAAEKHRTTDDWSTKSFAADAITRSDYPTLLARASASIRDDWAGKSLWMGFIRHVVGTGITFRSAARNAVTKAPLDAFNEVRDELWEEWASTPALCDVEGDLSFTDMQSLAAGEIVRAGQAFWVLDYEPSAENVGLRIQIVEPEQLDWSLSQDPETGDPMLYGVARNRRGRRTAIHVYIEDHPLDRWGTSGSMRIPAERVLHYFRKERPRQGLGTTRLAACLRTMWHRKMWEEYTLLRARFEAIGGAALTGPQSSGPFPLGPGLTGDPADTTQATDAEGNAQYTMEPGFLWDFRGSDTEVAFHDPKTPGGQHVPYSRQNISNAAAGAGLDYPVASRDFSGNTYYGQRQGVYELHTEVGPEQQRMVAQMLRPVYLLWTRLGILEGRLPAELWHASPAQQRAYLAHDVQPQECFVLDPAKQAAADKLDLEYLLSTRQEIANRRGKNHRQIIRQAADERELAAREGVPVPEDVGRAPVDPREPRLTKDQPLDPDLAEGATDPVERAIGA